MAGPTIETRCMECGSDDVEQDRKRLRTRLKEMIGFFTSRDTVGVYCEPCYDGALAEARERVAFAMVCDRVDRAAFRERQGVG